MRASDSPTSPRLPKPPGRENATEGIPYYTLPPGKPLARSHISRPLSTSIEDDESQELPSPSADISIRKIGNHTKPAKGGALSWNAPPLHKAYPKAERFSTLPATTVPADLILRAHEKKVGELATPPNPIGLQAEEKGKSKTRRRRTKSAVGLDFEWTTKTYILAASGYLLEYAGEGPFDRLPEKVLRLNRSSAAFASDMIPGRHWVLQVASAMGPDSGTAGDSGKSFFSRLPFRGGVEKRSASNMLLVFDNPETMDEWLATLRRTIEAMGGKKSVPETGIPVVEDSVSLRGQASQRTLIVRDSDRYSRSIPETQPWEPDFVVRRESDASFATTFDVARDRSIDDMSATNSVISHDGQQLESLRSSANRLSCISSGQRTMITSAGSSPACSPTAESFPASVEESPRRHLDLSSTEARLRPNASAILDRRKSLQTMTPFIEIRPNIGAQRPHSTLVGASAVPAEDPGTPAGNIQAPNFSVPHSSNRRYSRPPMGESPLPWSPPKESELPSRTLSRRPPTALRISRPLSMVEDQPSPRENIPERPATRHGEKTPPLNAELEPLPPLRPQSRVQTGRSSTPSLEVQSPPRLVEHSSPRRLSSVGALRQLRGQPPGSLSGPSAPPTMRVLHPQQTRTHDPERCHSSIDMYKPSNALSPPPRTTKRASMLPFVVADQAPSPAIHSLPLAPPPSMPLPPVPAPSNNPSKSDANVQSPPNRKSVPHFVESPPPAPPPTCALPPLPKKGFKNQI